MVKVKYTPSGVCAKEMEIEIEDNIVKSYKVLGGCPGNSLGVGALIKDMSVDEAINRLSGIKCGFKNTSCPNELSKALMKYKEENK